MGFVGGWTHRGGGLYSNCSTLVYNTKWCPACCCRIYMLDIVEMVK